MQPMYVLKYAVFWQAIVFKYIFGLPNRNRTCDPQLRRLMLYPTELWADCEAMQSKTLHAIENGPSKR
jgi:hypothetical protein